MLFAPTLADRAILPTAWRGRYFFNRIGQKQPLGYLCKSWALHSTKKSSRVEICVYTLTVQKSGLALGVWCICHAVLLKLEHRFCLASITQKPYF
ncbi:hypothetical protein IPC1343_24860 [Pseudomonas aeruginosa]|nr:hypothetical protein AO985_31780 [Pseudomonas aeruginosa]TEG10986.1 hypothetical protein IPC1343_24860 [Pseudomonas aeruginosa]